MSFYDHFLKSKTSTVSPLGKRIIDHQNNYFLKLIKKYRRGKLKEMKLLEIGPGKGYFAQSCREKKIDYWAIEGNKLMADQLKKRGFKNIFHALVPPINLRGKFEIIFMNQLLEHLDSSKEAIFLIKECQKRLKKGGLLIIASPDLPSCGFDFWTHDYTHNYPTSLLRIRQLLLNNDFKILKEDYFSFFIRGFLMTRLLSLLVRICYSLGLLKLLFGLKSDKIKVCLLASCLTIGQRK